VELTEAMNTLMVQHVTRGAAGSSPPHLGPAGDCMAFAAADESIQMTGAPLPDRLR